MTARDDELWLAAAVTLAADPSARVPCPACDLESLRFDDRPDAPRPEDGGAEMIVRWLRCYTCGASGYVGRYPA